MYAYSEALNYEITNENEWNKIVLAIIAVISQILWSSWHAGFLL